MPQATFRHAAAAAASPGDIWHALQSAERWGGLGLIDSVADEEHDAEGRLRSFSFTTGAGGQTREGTARTIGSLPGERIELALATREIKGHIGIDLTPETGRSLMAVRIEVESAGMPATVFWGIVREAISSGFPRRVEAFAAGFAG